MRDIRYAYRILVRKPEGGKMSDIGIDDGKILQQILM
jgi:hypothetical protein